MKQNNNRNKIETNKKSFEFPKGNLAAMSNLPNPNQSYSSPGKNHSKSNSTGKTRINPYLQPNKKK